MQKSLAVVLITVFFATQLIQAKIAQAYLYETSFEDYIEADEPMDEGTAGKAARGGNWRVNMQGHSVHPYDASGVRTGSKSIHVWGEKAWKWGHAVDLRLTYGETDVVTGQWLLPGQGRALEKITDLVYNQDASPDAMIEDAVPDQYGRYHWERDHVYYNSTTGVYSWSNDDRLVEPRARIANNEVGKLDSAYQRVYFKIVDLQGSSVQIARIYSGGSGDYIARVSLGGTLRLMAYGRDWQPTPVVGDVDVPVSWEPGKWYYIQLGFVRGNPGGFRVWFGEAGEEPTLTHEFMELDTSSAPPIDSVQTGIVDVFDSTWTESDPANTYSVVDMYFDDWVIDTKPIDGVQFQFNAYGTLEDKQGTPVGADIILYDAGTDTIRDSDSADTDGSYHLSVPTSYGNAFDLLYGNIDTFLGDYWIKLSDQSAEYNLYDSVSHLTEDPSGKKISFDVKTHESQTVEVYSPGKPERVLINGTEISEVSSLSDLIDNTWYWNAGKLYVRVTTYLPFGGEVLFNDDFSSGNCGNWTVVSGSWSCSNHYLESVSSTVEKETKSNVGSAWVDYNFESTFVNTSTHGSTRMLFRYEDEDNYYWLSIYADDEEKINSISLGTRDDGIDTNIFSDWVSRATPFKVTVSVKDEGSDVRIRVYLDNILKYNVLTSRNHASGGIGFWAQNYYSFRWDNVRVYTGDVTVFQTCSDETLYGECSSNKPYYCDNGDLVPRCSLCGCSSGQSCHSPTEQCYYETESPVIDFEDSFETNEECECCFDGCVPEGRNIGGYFYDVTGSVQDGYCDPNKLLLVVDPANAHTGDKYVTAFADVANSVTMENWPSECLLLRGTSPSQNFYVRWYMKFDRFPSTNEVWIFYMLGAKYDQLVDPLNPVGNKINDHMSNARVTLTYPSGNPTINFVNAFRDGSRVSVGSTQAPLQLDKWHKFEVWYKGHPVNGEYKLWIDDSQIFSLTGINTLPPADETFPRRFDLGAHHYNSETYSYSIDDVTRANYRVG